MVKEAKIIKIGNSKGIRIPKALLSKYDLEGEVILEERENGILIHNKNTQKLGWEETYKAMQAAKEDWSEWAELNDGWEDLD